jgi:hypothetical protein
VRSVRGDGSKRRGDTERGNKRHPARALS